MLGVYDHDYLICEYETLIEAIVSVHNYFMHLYLDYGQRDQCLYVKDKAKNNIVCLSMNSPQAVYKLTDLCKE